MAKKLISEEHSVLIEISRRDGYGFRELTDKEQRDEADEIITLIRRHVTPHVSARLHTYVDTQQEHGCEYCGSRWTEDSTTYNGGCCDKDEEANPEPAEQDQ